MTLSAKHVGREIRFLGFDGKSYSGNIVAVTCRGKLIAIAYGVYGLGMVRTLVDMATDAERIELA